MTTIESPEFKKHQIVREIMTDFSGLTGLSSEEEYPRRYLWTDAFAVCNFLELYHQSADERYLHHALQLVEQVHNTLGRHREDDSRSGWISGLHETEGRTHPTIGGLRIGKKLKERKPSDPFNESLEWDRDGQYYHYLTKWMHALNRVSRVTGKNVFNNWAIELAKTAHAKFTYPLPPDSNKRMYWKMSIDLSYPLVRSMGHHDPLDGLITYSQLQTTANENSGESSSDLYAEIAEMAEICRGKNWATDDPLGLGDLLFNACRLVQLIIYSNLEQMGLIEILDSSVAGLESYLKGSPFELPVNYRLAFRELGLSIGLRAVEKMQRLIEQNKINFDMKESLTARIENLNQYTPLADIIEMFWLKNAGKKTRSWTEHLDINMVMLATSLAPEGYLSLSDGKKK